MHELADEHGQNAIMLSRERDAILSDWTPVFVVHGGGGQSTPFVFCSPHSGRIYPQCFLDASRLPPRQLRKSEDCFVDELFAGAADLGAPMIAARFPRAFVDVNREPYELDPELIDGPLPAFANVRSVRVAGGLGTIARIVADQEEIYRERLPIAVVMQRIEQLYGPFHEALSSLVSGTCGHYGMAFLIDCHSMPSSAVGDNTPQRPDFVLGDRFGTSCDGRLTRCFRDRLAALGYSVQINRPYAGGFITEHYGRPRHAVHALQVEINRGLYMDERTLEKSPGFADLQDDLIRVTEALIRDLPGRLDSRQAAE